MSTSRNPTRHRRNSQAAGTSSSAIINGVYSGRITRSRARMMAAVNPAIQTIDEVRTIAEQAPRRVVTSPPPRAARNSKSPTRMVANSMQSLVLKRLRKEFQEMSVDPPENCTARLIEDNIFKWEATLIGASDSPYENGVFKLILNFPKNYPFIPPNVHFITKIYHCNISSEGLICLDVLYSHWSPALTASKLLLSILSLLTNPNPHHPLEAEIADNYINDRQAHDAVARQWTQLYATETKAAPKTKGQ